jgi:hypothetical protein
MSSKTIVIRGFVTTEKEYKEAEEELKRQFDTLWVTMPEGFRQRLIINHIMLKLENERLEKSRAKHK